MITAVAEFQPKSLPDDRQTPEEGVTLPTVEDNLGLASDFVLKHCRIPSGVPVEETEEFSDACLGLINACENFDPDKGFEFSTYAFYCIKNEVAQGFRRRKKPIIFVSDLKALDRPLEANGHLDVRLLDQLLSSTDDSEVDATDKKMLLAKYLDQKTFEEVGELFKITKQRVQQRISRAISRIQEKHRELIKGLE